MRSGSERVKTPLRRYLHVIIGVIYWINFKIRLLESFTIQSRARKTDKKPTIYEINNSNLTLSPLLKICQGLKATETSFVPTSSGSGGVGGSSTKRNTDKCKSKGIFRNYVIFKCSWDGKSGKSNAK